MKLRASIFAGILGILSLAMGKGILAQENHLIREKVRQKAITFWHSDRTPEALELLGLLYPDSPDTDNLIHDILVKEEQYDKADRILEELFVRYPDDSTIISKYLLYLIRNKENDRALKIFKEKEQRIAFSDETRMMIAFNLSDQGGAKEFAKRLLRGIDPTKLSTQSQKAYYFAQMSIAGSESREDEQRSAALRLLQVDPEDRHTHQVVAKYIIETSNYPAAKKAIQDNVTLFPVSGLTLAMLGTALEKKDYHWTTQILEGIHRENQELFGDVFPYIVQQLGTKGVYPIELLALCHLYLSQAPQESVNPMIAFIMIMAEKHLSPEGLQKEKQRLLENPQWQEDVWVFDYERAVERGASTSELRKLLQNALSQLPHSGILTVQYSTLLFAENQSSEAILLLSRFLEEKKNQNSPLLSVVALQLADIYAQTDQVDEALKYYEKSYQLDANDPILLNNYAYFLSLHRRELKKAEQMAAKAVELASDQPNLLDTYGYLLLQNSNSLLAEVYLRKAVEIMEKEHEEKPWYYVHYGDALFLNGHHQEANAQWQKAYTLSPETAIRERINGSHENLEQLIKNSL